MPHSLIEGLEDQTDYDMGWQPFRVLSPRIFSKAWGEVTWPWERTNTRGALGSLDERGPAAERAALEEELI